MKYFCLLLAMTVSAAFCGCGDDSGPPGKSDGQNTVQDAYLLPVSAEPKEEQSAEEKTETTDAPPAGESDSDSTDLNSLTAKQLIAEYRRLFDEFEKAIDAENANKALATAEQFASVQRELVSRIERERPDDSESLSTWRSILSSELVWLADRYRERDDLSAELKLRHELVVLLTKLYGQVHYLVTDARLAVRHVKRLQGLNSRQRATLSEMDRLYAQSVQHYREGKYREALRFAKKVVEVRSTILGEKHPQYAISLANLAFLYKVKGDYARAEPLCLQALEIQKDVQGEKHPEYTLSLNNLAGLYLSMAEYARAEPLYRQALEIQKSVLGEKHPLYATSLSGLAVLYKSVGDYARAEPLYRQTLEIQKSVQGEKHPDYALSLNNLAVLYRTVGDYARAESLFHQALEIQKAVLGEKHSAYATSLLNLAGLFERVGEYARAEPLYRQALEILKVALGENHPDYSAGLNNLAGMYHSLGNYAQAEPLYRQALEIQKSVLGEKHPDYAISLHNLAGLYLSMDEYDRAEPLYRQTLEIQKSVLGEKHPDYARSLNNLAGMYVSLGEYAQAEPLYRQALEIQKSALGEKHSDYAAGLNNLAMLYKELDDYARAEPLHRQSLEIRKAALGEQHPAYATSLNNLAGMYADAGRWTEATREYDLARRVLRRHVDHVLPGLTAREQRLFLERNERSSLYAALSSALARHQDAELRAHSAAWLLNGKGLALAAQAERQLVARGSDDLDVKKTADELRSVRARWARLTLNLPNADRIATYRKQLDELTQREAELSKELGQAGLGRSREEPWVELDEVREALPANSVLIELAKFIVFDFKAHGQEEQWQPAHYAAWIIPAAGKGDVQLVDLGAAEPIDAAIDRFRQSMQSSGEQIFDFGEPDATTDCRQQLQAIGKLVLAPLEKHLADAERWLISPDGALWLVPWEALSLADGRYAVEGHRISYLVSGRDLVLPSSAEWAQKLKHKSPSLIIADPDFEQAAGGEGSVPGEHLAAQQLGLPRSLPKGIPSEWSRLFGTKREAAAVQPKLEAYLGQQPDVYQRGKATEKIFKQLKRPRVVVLSTHGFFLPDQQIPLPQHVGLSGTSPSPALRIENPLLRCGLILAGANRRPDQAEAIQDDGILTGLEIVGTDLRGTELVILSACDTAVGDIQNGEGVAGLRQALQLAGAGTVVSSLWKVPDKQTTELMTAFWDNLANGDSKLDALRKAQLSLIQSHRKAEGAAHPYFWAAFTVTGQAEKETVE